MRKTDSSLAEQDAKTFSADELLAKAEHYCAGAEHCPADVRNKLYLWGADSDMSDSIIQKLIDSNFISESRYAEAFVHDKLLYNGWGRMKIRMALFAKKIDESVIFDALDTIDEEDYDRILHKVAASKKHATPDQMTRFLLQRGFTFDEIRSVLKS